MSTEARLIGVAVAIVVVGLAWVISGITYSKDMIKNSTSLHDPKVGQSIKDDRDTFRLVFTGLGIFAVLFIIGT